MELIPIIQETLIFFIAVLAIVLTVSYMLFKLNNKRNQSEIGNKPAISNDYSRFLSVQTYTKPVEYAGKIPQYKSTLEIKNPGIKFSNNASRTNRYTILNESSNDYNKFYKPVVKDFSTNFNKVNFRQF